MPSKRCGCASDSCVCVITGGDGVVVEGSGSPTDPFTVNAIPTGVNLAVQDENTLVRSGVVLIDFVGAGVTTTPGDEGEVIVTIPSVTPGMLGLTVSSQSFTTPGAHTWTRPANLLYAVVEVVGGGGGSGGIGATAASQGAASGGGGGGGYARAVLLAASLGTTESVTVGAGGTAGAATPTDGGAGGTTAFGSHCSATGGGGGALMTATATNFSSGGTGGTGAGGVLTIPGGAGNYGFVVATGVRLLQAVGGHSQMGRGGQPANNAVGGAGANYGGGGGGSTSLASQAARAGAVGGVGLVLVTSYSKT